MAETPAKAEPAGAPAQDPNQDPNQDAYKDSPIVHRICEACNNMFTVRAADPNHRCQDCHK